jgi:hypothetical protein
MGRRTVPAVLILALGCVPRPYTAGSFDPPIVEWHASQWAYRPEPSREDVVVWADGRIETSGGKRIVLSASEMDRLFVLLSDVEFLRCDTLDERLRVWPGGPREPEVVRDVLLVYSPRPGLRRELRRSWWDGAPTGIVFTPECYAGLGALDRFFRELLPDQRW